MCFYSVPGPMRLEFDYATDEEAAKRAVCEAQQAARRGKNDFLTPEQKLAATARVHLHVDIRPDDLRLFIVDHWQTIARLAHEVHERGHDVNDSAR